MSFSRMMQDYIEERYGDLPRPIEEVVKLVTKDRELYQDEDGFLTYEMKGDSVIFYDIYVRPAAREDLKAQSMGEKILQMARLLGKRVAIGFSELAGKNHLAGLKAMKRAGFFPAFKTRDEFVFLKGI